VKAKYVEETFNRWHVFGSSGTTCDIANADGDVFCGISHETAAKLIAARDAYVNALVAVFESDPSALIRLTDVVSR
jgi:hypothetical protein